MNGWERPSGAAAVGPSAIKECWGRGETPDAAAALALHPELRTDKSAVLDLAYEEYCLRAEAGEMPETEAFCARFPAYRSSLRRLLTTHAFLALNSGRIDSAAPVRWPEPGERHGDFTLIRELGCGAFARVFLATEASTGDRPVAVKFSFEGDAEARTLGRLNHPNVVPVLSARADGATGLTTVCMPFLGAATLTDVLDRAYPAADAAPPRRAAVFLEAAHAAARADDPAIEAAPPDRRMARGSYEEGVALVGLELAEALAFLHAREVYHLDLKPSNVLLVGNGRPMLLDFNLSADARNLAPRTGGTLPYVAPEQVAVLANLAPAAQAVDGRADLFSLGAILYELLTGTPAFGTLPRLPLRDAATLLMERQRAGCRPLREAAPGTSRGLAAVVESCLAFDRSARPASATAVAAALRQFLAGRRRAQLARPVAGLLLAAVAGVAGFGALPRPPSLAERGREAFRAGKYGEAERLFEQALDANKNDSSTRWSLALTRLKLSELESREEANWHVRLAHEGFAAAEGANPRPETTALIAYCLSRLAFHDEAIFEYGRAKAGGFECAALYNDRAYSYLKRNQAEPAEGDLETALRLQPDMGEAYYNRAVLSAQRSGQKPDRKTAAAGRADALAAIEWGVRSPDLYFDAANFTLEEGGSNASEEALSLLRKAVELGKEPRSIKGDLQINRALGAHPGLRELLALPEPTRKRVGNPRLVLPVTSLTD
jgi:serine/threonine protein kinase